MEYSSHVFAAVFGQSIHADLVCVASAAAECIATAEGNIRKEI